MCEVMYHTVGTLTLGEVAGMKVLEKERMKKESWVQDAMHT